MTFIVKEAVDRLPLFKVETPPTRFELFATEVVKDINGVEVSIPKSVGMYSIVDLQAQKDRLLADIGKIDEKIKAIEDATKV
jgi:hypothetical protein